MPRSSHIFRALIAVAGVALATGCSGGAQLAPASSSNAASQPAGFRTNGGATTWATSVFVADAFAGKVYQFADAANGAVLGTIADSSGPQGLDMDANGNLYVAAADDFAIKVYAPGSYSASASLSDPGEFISGVAVCPNGTVYAVNESTTNQGPGNIEFYAPGATSPSGVVPEANVNVGLAAACDPKNVLWFLYQTAAGDTNLASYDGKSVVEYGDRDLGGVNSGSGIRVWNAGKLAIGNLSTGINLVADPPKKKGTGRPVGCRAGSPFGFAFDRSDKHIYELESDELVEKCDRSGAQTYTIGQGILEIVSGVYAYPPGNT